MQVRLTASNNPFTRNASLAALPKKTNREDSTHQPRRIGDPILNELRNSAENALREDKKKPDE
jgi:hypothetical protein